MAISEEINIHIRAITGGFKGAMDGVRATLEQTRKEMKSASEVMSMSNVRLKDATTGAGQLDMRFKNLNTSSGKAFFALRQFIGGMRMFRMEMLGVMFFGMGIQRFFANFTSGAWEAFGISDRLKNTFQEMAMIALEPLAEQLHSALDGLDSLDEGTKATIGGVLLFGEALGTLLFSVGAAALGLNSLIGVWPKLAGFFAGGIAGFSSLVGSIASGAIGIITSITGIAAIIGVVIAGAIVNFQGIVSAWDTMWVRLGEIGRSFGDGLKKFISGDFIGGIWEMFKALFIQLPASFIELFVNIGLAIIQGINMIADKVQSAVAGIPIIGPLLSGLIGGVRGGLGAAGGIVGGIMNFLGGLIPRFQHGGIVTRPTLGLIGEKGPEAVVPLSGGGGMAINPTYNISATVSNDMDVRALAARLNDYLVSDYRRMRFR